MSFKVTVALAGDPQSAFTGEALPGMRFPQDFDQPYAEREKVELEVDRAETLGSVLERAAEHWNVRSDWGAPINSVASIDFYNPERPLKLHGELALLDSDDRARWTWQWKEITYAELVEAREAALLPGDPRRPFLLLNPGMGNGLLADWQTLITVWEASWHVLERVATIGGAAAGAKMVLDRLRARTEKAPEVVRDHYEEWQRRGARPDNVNALLGLRPWHPDDFARRFGCTPEEAEAFLLGAGYAQAPSGLYRRGEDPEAILLQGNLDFMIHTAMTTNRVAVEQVLQERVARFLESGQPADWHEELEDLPEDGIGFRDPEEVQVQQQAPQPSRLHQLWWRIRYRG